MRFCVSSRAQNALLREGSAQNALLREVSHATPTPPSQPPAPIPADSPKISRLCH